MTKERLFYLWQKKTGINDTIPEGCIFTYILDRILNKYLEEVYIYVTEFS